MTTPRTTPADPEPAAADAKASLQPAERRRAGGLHIDRCVCHDVTFSEVVQWSRESGSRDVGCVAAALGCTQGCGMCLPYVARALRTGETAFHEILPHPGS